MRLSLVVLLALASCGVLGLPIGVLLERSPSLETILPGFSGIFGSALKRGSTQPLRTHLNGIAMPALNHDHEVAYRALSSDAHRHGFLAEVAKGNQQGAENMAKLWASSGGGQYKAAALEHAKLAQLHTEQAAKLGFKA